MNLTLNKEFLRRHIFALAVLAGMGLWFGYDGVVRYPNTPAAALYATIESAQPPPDMSDARLEAFKAQKIATQRGLGGVLLIAAALVALHLLSVARFRFSFEDAGGFTWRGRHYAWGDIRNVDRAKWEKKGILRIVLSDGTVTLDAWHHQGVAEFEKCLSAHA